MQEKRNFTITSLIIILLLIAAFVGLIYLLAPEAFAAQLLILIGATTVLALLVWIVIVWLGGRAIDNAGAAEQEASAPPVAEPASAAIEEPLSIPSAPVEPAEPDDMPAIQMLAILQRKGRLIDFLQEDLSAFDDAQIGAAVRTIHEGCREALNETMTLDPIYAEAENSQVTVPAGFDANAIRLVGNVSSDPPFTGTLRHRGWRVTEINLPERTGDSDDEMVIAAAEVEVGG